MSVYCFCKLVTNAVTASRLAVEGAAQRNGIAISFEVDVEDQESFDSVSDLSAPGLMFAAYSGPGETDMVRAWNCAREEALTAFRLKYPERNVPVSERELYDLPIEVQDWLRGTQLGAFLADIIGLEGVGGVALFDGSIREIVVDTPERCLSRVLRTLLLPWDCGPDALFVWHRNLRIAAEF